MQFDFVNYLFSTSFDDMLTLSCVISSNVCMSKKSRNKIKNTEKVGSTFSLTNHEYLFFIYLEEYVITLKS